MEKLTSKLWIMNELGVVGFVHPLFRYYAIVFIAVLVAVVTDTCMVYSSINIAFFWPRTSQQKKTASTTNSSTANESDHFFRHNPQHFTLCKFDLQDSMLHENCLHTFGWVQTHHHNCHEQFTFVLFHCMYECTCTCGWENCTVQKLL